MTVSIKEGDVLRDNDPRVKGRTLRVLTVGDATVVCESETSARTSRRTIIALTRIHDDGKERRTGFTVVRARR